MMQATGQTRIDHAARLIETTAVADRSAMVFDLLGASGVVLDLDPVGRVRVLALMDDGIDRTLLARAASDWLRKPDNARRASALLQFLNFQNDGSAVLH